MKTAEEIIKKNIPSGIVNIKGKGDGKPQYKAEIAIIKQCMEEYLQQSYASQPMSAEPTVQQLREASKNNPDTFLAGALYVIDNYKLNSPLMSAEQYSSGAIHSLGEFPTTKSMSAEQVELGYYYPLFKFFSDEHGLTLLDSQLQDVIHECKKFIEPATTGGNWKSEYDNCRALLQELVSLKVMKENLYKGSPDGKEYAERKPKAWQAAQQFLNTAPTVKAGISILTDLLAKHGGKIVSSNSLSSEWIEQARVSNRMYIDNNSLGYIWEPEFKNGMPDTVEEVELFEWCYPLETKLPESLKEFNPTVKEEGWVSVEEVFTYEDMMDIAGWMAAADNKRPISELKYEAEMYIKTKLAARQPTPPTPTDSKH